MFMRNVDLNWCFMCVVRFIVVIVVVYVPLRWSDDHQMMMLLVLVLLVVRCFAVAFALQSLFVTNDVAVANVSSARAVVTVVATQFYCYTVWANAAYKVTISCWIAGACVCVRWQRLPSCVELRLACEDALSGMQLMSVSVSNVLLEGHWFVTNSFSVSVKIFFDIRFCCCFSRQLIHIYVYAICVSKVTAFRPSANTISHYAETCCCWRTQTIFVGFASELLPCFKSSMSSIRWCEIFCGGCKHHYCCHSFMNDVKEEAKPVSARIYCFKVYIN